MELWIESNPAAGSNAQAVIIAMGDKQIAIPCPDRLAAEIIADAIELHATQPVAANDTPVCPHCRGAGEVNDWKHGGMKSCFRCAGTGGKTVAKLAYNLHRG